MNTLKGGQELTDAAAIAAYNADRNRHYTTNPRHDDATPDWDDLNPEEQLIVDENRYLLENGGIAFGAED